MVGRGEPVSLEHMLSTQESAASVSRTQKETVTVAHSLPSQRVDLIPCCYFLAVLPAFTFGHCVYARSTGGRKLM